MFAQLFISPLIRENAVEREVKSINSEFEIAMKEDINRTHDLFLRNIPNTRLNRFMWGNSRSL
jgi:nardilysin